jgi:glycosyltransferase involved in cell wall biosynthesis
MKILHICGIDFTLTNLLKPQIDYFLNQGYQIECCCSPSESLAELSKQGYILHPIFMSRQIQPLSNLKSIIKLARLIKKNKYDLIHVHNPIASVLGRIAARIAGHKKVFYTAHGFYFHENMPAQQYIFYHTIEKLTAIITDKILTQSSEDLNTAIKTGIGNPHKVKYLGNGIDLSRFNPSRLQPDYQQKLKQELQLPENLPIIAITSRITAEKGYRELIEALSLLKIQFSLVHLLVIGGQLNSERDKFQTELINLIQHHNLEHSVTLTGIRRDVPELLGLADIFTLPSYREGLPRSILEAMAMELPVVTTNIRGCRETVVDGETGWIVPVKDSQSLAIALAKLLSDSHLRTKFGLAGRKRVEQWFDENYVFQRLEKFYINDFK